MLTVPADAKVCYWDHPKKSSFRGNIAGSGIGGGVLMIAGGFV